MADFLAGPITDPLPQRVTPASVSLVDAASVAIDLSQGDVFYLAITDDRTLAAPSNVKGGQRFSLVVKQAAAGGKKLAFNAAYVGVNDGMVSAAANSITVFTFLTVVDGTSITHKCVGLSTSGAAVVGQATVLNTASSATVTVGTAYNGKPVLLSINNAGTAFAAAAAVTVVGDIALGVLTIKFINANTGAAVAASADTKVAFYIAG